MIMLKDDDFVFLIFDFGEEVEVCWFVVVYGVMSMCFMRFVIGDCC